MKANNKLSYVQFPLFLLHEILINKANAINKILDYGVYRFAKSVPLNDKNVARQICYQNYRGSLTKTIRKQLLEYNFEHFGNDEDYNGFFGENFEPEEEIEELLEVFNKNEMFHECCIEFYTIIQALDMLGLKGDVETILKTAKAVEELIKPNEVMPMIGVHLLINFRDNAKSEQELIQLLGYIAIRSIIGKKPFVKTTKSFLLKRMFGNHSSLEYYEKYNKRYQWEKLLEQLQLNWKINIYSNRTRGIWVSVGDEFSFERLVEHAETVKSKNRINNLKRIKQEMIKTVLFRMNNQR